MKYRNVIFTAFYLLLQMERGLAQDLDPRAYVWVPVGISILGLGYGYTYGGVLTDPTIPVKDVNATIHTTSLGAAHVFSMFHKTAQISANLPWNWATVTGSVQEAAQRITRNGFGDMRIRYSILLSGGPAANPVEIAKTPQRT
ncbi:MAG TPA: hypothetical protein DIC22_09765, partial [Chitinophagaceae bacterium]|nr:hypothetical protein [Chitinophagaceae bacterium]